MSAAIDLSKPLTDQEREYLLMRGRAADAERADAMHGTEAPDTSAGDGTGPQQVPLMTSEQRAGEAARLRARLAEIEGTEADSDASDEDEVDPYEVWTVPELDAELSRRNLSTSGKKPEKVARLNEDDAAAAPEFQEQ